MNVLMKCMRMPRACLECGVQINPFCATNDIIDFETRGKRPENCPLVEVPKHGRLIDADVLVECLATLLQFPSNLVNEQWIVNTLREQPTIIPAEEGVT